MFIHMANRKILLNYVILTLLKKNLMNKKISNTTILAIVLVVLAALSRIALYPNNFSPIIAIALFSGAVIHDKKWAFLLPLGAMLLSDILFEVFNIDSGFWGYGQVLNYAVLVGITAIGFSIKKINVLNVTGFTILSSLLFFFLSNAVVWVTVKGMYAPGISGLRDSLIAGLPFLKNGLIADLTFSAILFGGYALLSRGLTKKVLS